MPEPIIPVAVIRDAVIRADAAGIDATCHCFDDLAVRSLLDAVEAAIKINPPLKKAHTITHGTVVHPSDIARFAELGVIFDSTGTWMSFDPLLQSISMTRLGGRRVNSIFPVNDVVGAGGTFSFGSEWPVSGYVSSGRHSGGCDASAFWP